MSTTLQTAVRSKKLDSAIAIVAEALLLFDSPEDAEKALDALVAGDDGILGTSDDVLSPTTVANIRLLLDSNLVKEILPLVSKATSSCCGLLKLFGK